MAYRVLELTLVSARDLKKVNRVTRMQVYAVASVSGDRLTRQVTQPDRSGGRHPTWNATLRFAVPATAGAASGAFLHVLLRTERVFGDRDVGEVSVPLPDLLAGAGNGPRSAQYASYEVRKVHSGKPRGVLNFSYQLGAVEGPKAAPRPGRPDEPVMAYPVAVPCYPPPPAYVPTPPPPAVPCYPPPPGYVTTPPAAAAAEGRGCPPPPVVQPPWKNKNGDFGLGAGGMLVGDMVPDSAAYDAGYRAGLNDGSDGGLGSSNLEAVGRTNN